MDVGILYDNVKWILYEGCDVGERKQATSWNIQQTGIIIDASMLFSKKKVCHHADSNVVIRIHHVGS